MHFDWRMSNIQHYVTSFWILYLGHTYLCCSGAPDWPWFLAPRNDNDKLYLASTLLDPSLDGLQFNLAECFVNGGLKIEPKSWFLNATVEDFFANLESSYSIG